MGNIITDFSKFQTGINEGSVAGFAVGPEVQMAIMTIVPAMVAAMPGQTFADEIKEWLGDNMEKVVSLIQRKKRNGAVMESIDVDTQSAIMLAVPVIVGLAFGHTYKDDVKDWLRENKDKAKSFFKKFLKK